MKGTGVLDQAIPDDDLRLLLRNQKGTSFNEDLIVELVRKEVARWRYDRTEKMTHLEVVSEIKNTGAQIQSLSETLLRLDPTTRALVGQSRNITIGGVHHSLVQLRAAFSAAEESAGPVQRGRKPDHSRNRSIKAIYLALLAHSAPMLRRPDARTLASELLTTGEPQIALVADSTTLREITGE